MKNSNLQHISIILICIGIILVILDLVNITKLFGGGFLIIILGIILINRSFKTIDIDLILYVLEIDLGEKKQIYSLDKGLLFKQYKDLQLEYQSLGYKITLVSATTFYASLGEEIIKISLKTNPLLSN